MTSASKLNELPAQEVTAMQGNERQETCLTRGIAEAFETAGAFGPRGRRRTSEESRARTACSRHPNADCAFVVGVGSVHAR
jgi:hypothetical protein